MTGSDGSIAIDKAAGQGDIASRAALMAFGDFPVLRVMQGVPDSVETGALAAALAPAKISHYLGIDLRPEAISEATRRWSLPAGTIEFHCLNAAVIDRMRSLPPFDFIFIRHQNYWDDPAIWDRILTNALSALAPDGLLSFTSYFGREHELLKAALRTRGAELRWDVRHHASRPLPEAPGKSVDRHLALFGKKAATQSAWPDSRPISIGP